MKKEQKEIDKLHSKKYKAVESINGMDDVMLPSVSDKVQGILRRVGGEKSNSFWKEQNNILQEKQFGDFFKKSDRRGISKKPKRTRRK